ncbi:HlyD family type I secretion periplasmic adaptor subunit [Duganella radicis]|uniref:Membrane fusion protein (MFP) family protein n=1 Tax=Duganella radicis TaxID=551988 RepID=A0A6L6PPF9_9BURK|nr:HlyD family type I secretion periplasmic adaptor subunit [Duganella radicis]MTV40547.1 HlyD family type I secretion periplasmic adaptor subunit [Duganella radicis]
MSNFLNKKDEAADVVSHDVAPLTVNVDAGSYARLGWLIVLVGVCGFLVWAMLAPLDKGVPLSGVVAKEGNRKSVQHLAGGIVEKILVKDGAVVKAGQTLVRMNAVQVRAQAEITRVQYFSSVISVARLEAERDGAASFALPAELAPYKDDARIKDIMALQTQLMHARRQALKDELAAVDENIAGLKQQVQGLIESRDSKKAQMGFLKEQLDGLRDLAKEGYVPRSRLLDQERTYAQVSGGYSEDIGNIGRYQSQVLELALRRSQRTQEFQKEVRSSLSDAQKEADAQGSRLIAQEQELANADVKSPVDGIVVGMNVFTEGGVVGAGAHLMDVVPSDGGLVVEGQLPVNLIDRVHDGLPVELIFSAFNANKTPHIPGQVIQVSADRAVDERANVPPYYKVRFKVTPEGAQMIAAHKLNIQPGMPVEVFIITGQRTMMNYLLKPVFDRAKSALTED